MVRYTNDILVDKGQDEIRELQEQRLFRQLEYVYSRSPYYQRQFDDLGVKPRDIRSMSDFVQLPTMMDKDRERLSQEESFERFGHPFGMHLCCDLEDVVVTATTSGTTGEPTFTYTMTERDVADVVPQTALLVGQAGIGAGDRVLFSYALGIYATTPVLLTLRRSGVLPIDVDVRAGAKSILQYAKLTRPSGAFLTPSLAQHLIGTANELDIDLTDLGFRGIFLTGELGLGIPRVKRLVEEAYGCPAFDYSSPAGSGLAISCNSEQYYGMHLISPELDLYPSDLLDPVTKKPASWNGGSAEGEAVYTALHRQARPLIRYATGDLVRVESDPCPGCGFKGMRIFFIGRSDDMLIVKGVNVFPNAIREVVNQFAPDDITGELRIVLTTPPPRVEPPLTVKLEFGEHTTKDALPNLERAIGNRLHDKLRVRPRFEWVPPGSLEISTRKTGIIEKRY